MTETRKAYTTRPRYPKRDANHNDIVAELRRLGYIVRDVSSLSGDNLDLFVCGYHHGIGRAAWVNVEVKTLGGGLTRNEQDAIFELERFKPPVYIIAYTVEDVIDWFDGRKK